VISFVVEAPDGFNSGFDGKAGMSREFYARGTCGEF
jgi:hypothetical protein